jgi:hypothetical protein
MATGKKSFVAYADWKETFEALPDDIAGKLIKHIFAYVNDENPTADYVITAVFANIKNTLKRDLKKWEDQQEQRKQAGLRSAEVRKLNATLVNGRSFSSTVSDSVSVSDIKENIDTALPLKFSFFQSMINYGFEKKLVSEWISVRKTKKLSQTETAFKNFIIEVEKTKADKNEILTECIVKSWGGFKSGWYEKENISSSKIERPEKYKKMVF